MSRLIELKGTEGQRIFVNQENVKAIRACSAIPPTCWIIMWGKHSKPVRVEGIPAEIKQRLNFKEEEHESD